MVVINPSWRVVINFGRANIIYAVFDNSVHFLILNDILKNVSSNYAVSCQ